jgi:hypothetical protein
MFTDELSMTLLLSLTASSVVAATRAVPNTRLSNFAVEELLCFLLLLVMSYTDRPKRRANQSMTNKSGRESPQQTYLFDIVGSCCRRRATARVGGVSSGNVPYGGDVQSNCSGGRRATAVFGGVSSGYAPYGSDPGEQVVAGFFARP